MIISKVQLSNFRNLKKKTFSFSPKTTVIVGPNASGKTNIMEALFLLSTGKSFRARVEEETISYGEEIARVEGVISDGRGDHGKHRKKQKARRLSALGGNSVPSAIRGVSGDTTSLEVVLTRGEITVGEDPEKTERAPRKRLLINGLGKRLYNFAGNFKVVLFGPQDLELVIESPSRRRNFLDTVLEQVDREYRRATLSYEKGLRQRNRLLLRIREEGLSRSQLVFWDRLLIKNGDYISEKRAEFIDFVNATPDFKGEDFSLEYDKSAISEARFEQYKDEEVAAATTLVGPHRDDFCFRLKKSVRRAQGGRARDPRRYGSRGESRESRDLRRFGSRGEQRMGVLWLKLAELAYIEQETEEKPTLLLDDIFSELDHEHREVVMKAIGNQQTIVTTTDPHFIEGLKKVEKIELRR